MKPYEMIEKMNDLLSEQQNIGDTIIDVIIDAREDEGLPPLTGEELAAAKALCDENAARSDAIDEEISSLRIDYMTETGKWPVYVDGIIPGFREPFNWEN